MSSSGGWFSLQLNTETSDGKTRQLRLILIIQLRSLTYWQTNLGLRIRLYSVPPCYAIPSRTPKTTAAELEEQFGQKVTSVVLEVTDDKSLQKPIRKQLQIDNSARLSAEAKLVNLADKICNLRDTAVSPKVGWSLERTQAYFDWAAQVIAGLRGINPTLEALFDEVYMRGKPKG